ncbi:MAG TPA: hypothetical protein G4N96_11830 [Chloroflexi bacterium]|nr:hypothetical protein [Chloroflexota bacterium]
MANGEWRMCEFANVRMANVRMCECANVRICECANGEWRMCECANLRIEPIFICCGAPQAHGHPSETGGFHLARMAGGGEKQVAVKLQVTNPERQLQVTNPERQSLTLSHHLLFYLYRKIRATFYNANFLRVTGSTI